MKPFRLNLYKKYIVDFDSLDRNFSLNKHIKLEHMVIQTNSCLTSSKLQALTLSVTLEILTQQRILLKSAIKKSKSNQLKISVNKHKLLMLLDIYLSSIFLVKTNNFNFPYGKLVSKIHFLISNQVINNLNLVTSNKSLIQINKLTQQLLTKFY